MRVRSVRIKRTCSSRSPCSHAAAARLSRTGSARGHRVEMPCSGTAESVPHPCLVQIEAATGKPGQTTRESRQRVSQGIEQVRQCCDRVFKRRGRFRAETGNAPAARAGDRFHDTGWQYFNRYRAVVHAHLVHTGESWPLLRSRPPIHSRRAGGCSIKASRESRGAAANRERRKDDRLRDYRRIAIIWQ